MFINIFWRKNQSIYIYIYIYIYINLCHMITFHIGFKRLSVKMEFSKSNSRFYAYVEWKNGTTAAETYRKLFNAFPDDCPTERTIRNWFSDFTSGKRLSLDDHPRSGRPSATTTDDLIEKVRNIIEQDERMSLRHISEMLDVNKESIRTILHENLNRKKILSIWVPYQLTDDHKRQRIESSRNFLQLVQQYGKEYLMKRWITVDETWISFSPTLWRSDLRVWASGDDPRPRAVQNKKFGRRTMLILAFTADGKFHIEVTKSGEAINSERYTEFIQNSLTKFSKDRRRVNMREILWQHDNARPHSSKFTTEFFQKKTC